TLVVAIATIITINSGTAAALVQSPNNTRRPHAISKVPTKCAVKYGCAKPILVKRTTPMLGSMYLRMPCVEKMSPTATRMSRIVAGPCVGLNKNRRTAFADPVIDIRYRYMDTIIFGRPSMAGHSCGAAEGWLY